LDRRCRAVFAVLVDQVRLAAAILILAHLVATSSWPDLFRPSIAAPCCGDGRNKSGHDVERLYGAAMTLKGAAARPKRELLVIDTSIAH
jgi:hypothetical protein